MRRQQEHYQKIKMYTDRLKSRSKSRSTSRKRAAQAEKETRKEEKEAMSTEDVEEMVVEIKDKTIEPAEGVQQPDEEPEIVQPEILLEITPQEILPENRQPEELMNTKDRYIIEMLKKIEEGQKKMEEGQKRIIEGQKSMKESLCRKLDECHNNMREVIDRTITESRKFGEKLRREREQREQASQKIDGNKPETKEVPEKEHSEPDELPLDDDQMEIEEIPENKNIEPTSPEPVSYTHLDVYKRQSMYTTRVMY